MFNIESFATSPPRGLLEVVKRFLCSFIFLILIKISFLDVRRPVILRARASGVSPDDDAVILLFKNGDLSNPPSSLGDPWIDPARIGSIHVEDNCDDTGFFLGTRERFSFNAVS